MRLLGRFSFFSYTSFNRSSLFTGGSLTSLILLLARGASVCICLGNQFLSLLLESVSAAVVLAAFLLSVNISKLLQFSF